MRTTTFTVAVFLWLSACGGARVTPQIEAVSGDSVEMWVQSGHWRLPIFEHDDGRYLLGEEGVPYAICLLNRGEERIEAVVSVDGRDVVSGRLANYRADRGYVILGNEQVCIEGFRQSLDQVASFVFTPKESSYASQMGDGTNVGVIGVAVFDEDETRTRPAIAASPRRSASVSAPMADAVMAERESAAPDAEEDLGTGYGDSVGSEVEVVPFRRKTPAHPMEIVALYYNDRIGLEEMGIVLPRNLSPVKRGPDPFPAAKEDLEFAPPPPSR